VRTDAANDSALVAVVVERDVETLGLVWVGSRCRGAASPMARLAGGGVGTSRCMRGGGCSVSSRRCEACDGSTVPCLCVAPTLLAVWRVVYVGGRVVGLLPLAQAMGG
jgi:hypothetical protein